MSLNYTLFLLFLVLSSLLSIIIVLLSWLFGEKIPSIDKVTIYECGFNPFHSLGEPFSIKFFMIGVIFIVFDLEIALLFPWSCSINMINILGQSLIYIFLIVLVLGLIYEWQAGGLEWE